MRKQRGPGIKKGSYHNWNHRKRNNIDIEQVIGCTQFCNHTEHGDMNKQKKDIFSFIKNLRPKRPQIKPEAKKNSDE
jgi:hypothetical protein